MIVIDKADHPMASTMARHIRSTLLLAPDKGGTSRS